METEEDCEVRKEEISKDMNGSVPVFHNTFGKKKPPIAKQSKQKMD